jgi:hypothetical protein
MPIGVGTLVIILLIVAILYFPSPSMTNPPTVSQTTATGVFERARGLWDTGPCEIVQPREDALTRWQSVLTASPRQAPSFDEEER